MGTPVSCGVLVYLSGLGLGREFLHLGQPEGIEVIVPTWIEPSPCESLSSYAHRLAISIRRNDVTHIAGASFGGVLALEMANILKVKGVIVVSGILTPEELPFYFRLLKPLPDKFLGLLLDLAFLISAGISSYCGVFLTKNSSAFFRWFQHADKSMVKWGAAALLNWVPTYNIEGISLLQIHGDADGIFPQHKKGSLKAVPGGGHVLTVTHSEVVNRVIFEFISKHHDITLFPPCW